MLKICFAAEKSGSVNRCRPSVNEECKEAIYIHSS